MPRGFAKEGNVLQLKKSLYGLRQSPKNFFNFISSKLENAGFESMVKVDPCLFISDKVICLVYVDDTLFFSPSESLKLSTSIPNLKSIHLRQRNLLARILMVILLMENIHIHLLLGCFCIYAVIQDQIYSSPFRNVPDSFTEPRGPTNVQLSALDNI
mmetsp:Transcript_907/g.1791  ORF Transcript_907/g.1791 Transcript_907/m.1791 type:complete len:157 (+) Transcript_907:643-1113(+)